MKQECEELRDLVDHLARALQIENHQGSGGKTEKPTTSARPAAGQGSPVKIHPHRPASPGSGRIGKFAPLAAV